MRFICPLSDVVTSYIGEGILVRQFVVILKGANTGKWFFTKLGRKWHVSLPSESCLNVKFFKLCLYDANLLGFDYSNC